MPIKQPIIEVKNLNFAYNGNVILEQVSFRVEPGDYVGIVGPNGGGKTTLLKILAGLLQPQSGSVIINGAPLRDGKTKLKVGYVPQRVAQDNSSFPATVYEVVESGLTPALGLFGRFSQSDRQAIERALKIAGIGDLRDKLMSTLSGGQRQRAYVARALAAEPAILLLDEPFVGVDLYAQRDFFAFLKTLNKKQRLTILLVSHDVDMIATEVKSVICLNHGLLCFGRPKILRADGVMNSLYGKKITHLHHIH
ncbi:MAG: metal ABC transporter ATP-binding protein [bacterium]|nr:metal ABC transporter ATP-binding protein [bacterium]